MSVNYGSSKIGKINVGSSAIGKVYQGSTLVFQSGLGMPVYGAKFYIQDLEVPTFLFGEWSSNAICGSINTNPIKTITGTLGASCSSVEI
jgi:hypothetical protein